MKHNIQSHIFAPKEATPEIREKIHEIAEILPTGSCVLGIWNTEDTGQLDLFIEVLSHDNGNFHRFLHAVAAVQEEPLTIKPASHGYQFTIVHKACSPVTEEQSERLDACVQTIVDLLDIGSAFIVITKDGAEDQDLVDLANFAAKNTDAQVFRYIATRLAGQPHETIQ